MYNLKIEFENIQKEGSYMKIKNKLFIGIPLMILSACFACSGQLFWKIFTVNKNIFILFLGFLLYGIGALLMIIAYRFGKLSVLQPILALNYAISIIFGKIVFNESITLFKCLGILFIFCGVFFIATGDKE